MSVSDKVNDNIVLYCRSVLWTGCVVNASLSEIVDVVLTVDEFSVDDCECLHAALQHLSTSVIDVFRTEVVCMICGILFTHVLSLSTLSLQCFDTVGWAAGRASGL